MSITLISYRVQVAIEEAAERNSRGYCGTAPAGKTLLDLLSRLLDDHQRVEAHHAHQCALCAATQRAIVQAAEFEVRGPVCAL